MPDILHRVGIAAEPMRVFEALTTLAGIQGWWVSTATGDAAEGTAFEFGNRHRLEVTHADPSVVRWRYTGTMSEWLDTEIEFRLEWRENQTFVNFSHRDWREPTEMMRHCSTKWATFLVSLKELVERGDGRPTPRDVKIEVDG
jgi:uncharacterized protein YndB with AHSA1/START domain